MEKDEVECVFVFAGMSEGGEGRPLLVFITAYGEKFMKHTPHFLKFTKMAQAHSHTLLPGLTHKGLSLTSPTRKPNPKPNTHT